MKLSELIDVVREVHVSDTSRQISGVPDALKSPSTYALLFDQAQNEFARRTWCFKDKTSSICTIPLVVDDKDYAYDSKIIAVLGLRLSDTRIEMPSADEFMQNGGQVVSDPLAFLEGMAPAPYNVNSGRPRTYSLDGETRTITFDRAPTSDLSGVSIKLRVVRLPINSLSGENLDATPEVPSEYHYALTYFVAKEVLGGADLDVGEQRAAAAMAAKWEEAVERARRDILSRDRMRSYVHFRRW